MQKETRTIRHDDDIQLEAYRFEGFARAFPNHFHDYYVIGFIEEGTRRLSCRGREYTVGRGSILVFNPNDSHGCVQCDGGTLAYRAVNIPKQTMRTLTEEITGERTLPEFAENVIENEELGGCLRALHRAIMEGAGELEKEELLLLLVSLLIEQYGRPVPCGVPACGEEIGRVCQFIDAHYSERVTLGQLCACAGLSKSTLLRAFTKAKGLTPYRYLQAVRIGRAKELLEEGLTPVEAAMRTGFADQSHFSNFFNLFIGLPPAAYGRIFREERKTNEPGERKMRDRDG